MAIRLQPEQEKMLHDAESRIKVVREAIAAAKRAGIDMGELEEQLNNAEKMRAGLLREFGSGSRPRR